MTIRRAIAVGLTLLLYGMPIVARAQQPNADSIITACGANDTTGGWFAVAKGYALHHLDQPGNPELRNQLLALDSVDQSMRRVPAFMDSIKSPDFVRRMAARDAADAKALMQIVERVGWPTRTLVGVDGAAAAFAIAQHNDSIRDHALRMMLALPAGEVNPSDLATLQDRVLTSAGKRQKYGTQFAQKPGTDTLVLDPVEDLPNLEARRAAVGLMPLDTYLCTLRGIYHRPVVKGLFDERIDGDNSEDTERA